MQLTGDDNPKPESQDPPPVPDEGTKPDPKETEERKSANQEVVLKRRRSTVTIDAQNAEISKLKVSLKRSGEKYSAAKGRIAKLEYDLEEGSRTYKEHLAKREQQIQVLGDELARTKELLEARTKELSGAQSFLSTTDRKSESEVLGIVRNLNESIFQTAANLAEEWEKEGAKSSRSSRTRIPKEYIDSLSHSFGPALVYQVYYRRPAGVTFLVQSCLCDFAATMTSSWQHNKELSTLRSVYQRLCASEGQAISARWRSLAHSRLSDPPSHSDSLVQNIAKILWITAIFPSHGDATEFVKAKALTGIKTIERLAMQLESVFMVDIISCDMCLLSEAPSAIFDKRRMAREYEGAKVSMKPDKVAGTTEVGVEKSVYGRKGEGARTQLLLKPKVVLDRDLAGL